MESENEKDVYWTKYSSDSQRLAMLNVNQFLSASICNNECAFDNATKMYIMVLIRYINNDLNKLPKIKD